MAIGIERLALLSNIDIEDKTLVSFIILSSNFEEKAYKIAHDLRTINPEIIIDVQLAEGSLKSKLRKASKNNAKFAIIIGEEEIETNTIIIKVTKCSGSSFIFKNDFFINSIGSIKVIGIRIDLEKIKKN